jgi:hypothetical protein
MTNDMDELESEDKRLCSDCVGEVFLKADMQKNGRDDACSYCESKGKTFSIAEIADRIDHAIDQHFYLTSTEPSGLEYAMIKEGDLDWERKGEPIADIIQEYAQVESGPADDIRGVLEDRHSDRDSELMGYENPFDEEAHYAESEVDDRESQAGWRHFEDSLKTEARYFSRTAEWTLKDIFEGIAEHRTRDGSPIVVEAGPGTRIDAIYRARIFQSADKLEKALERPDKEIGAPPSKTALGGRMNAYGISVFYGATDQAVALAEVRPPVGSRVIVGRFELIRPIRLLDVEALRLLNVTGSIFDPSYLSRLQKAKFLEWLSRRIALPVMPDDESYDYIPTQAIADFLASNANPLVHGILYPSVQGGEGRSNIVLFHKAARVQPLDLPDGTEISVSTYDETDGGRETNYWVSEEVPPFKTTPSTKGLNNFPFRSEPLNEPLDTDTREFVLKLNVSSVVVHHVRGLTYNTEPYNVSRHRFEKRETKF